MYNYIIQKIINVIENNYSKSNNRLQLLECIECYIESLHTKLKQTKNTIFRNEPVDFYQNYIPLTLMSKDFGLRVNSAMKLFSEQKKIGIIGTAGSGKTTLLKYIALSSIEEGVGYPIFIELRTYNKKEFNFEDYVASQINKDLIKDIKTLFQTGNFIFIFDGYDEIDYLQDGSLIDQIDRFISQYSSNYFVVSSRPETNLESISPLYIFSISPLNEDDIYLFIDKIEMPSKSKKEIYHSIKKDHDIRNLLSIPLFLAFYITTFNAKEPVINKSVFFRNIIDLLFSQHDSISKLGYVREKISNLNKDSLEEIASLLAFRMLFSARIQLTKDELFSEFERIKATYHYLHFENEKLLFDFTITTNILQKDNNYYIFPHVLILEYLSSLFIFRLNSSKKKELYEKMIQNNSLTFSASFYGFLYELDRKEFLKYYLLPIIESILSNFNSYLFSRRSNIKNEIIIEFINYNFLNTNYSNSISKIGLENIYFTLKDEVEKDDSISSFFDIL